MIQEILVILSITGAVVYIIWSIFRVVQQSRIESETYCNGCSLEGCKTTPKDRRKQPSVKI